MEYFILEMFEHETCRVLMKKIAEAESNEFRWSMNENGYDEAAAREPDICIEELTRFDRRILGNLPPR